MSQDSLLNTVLAVCAYSALGIALMVLMFAILRKVMGISIKKEIEGDQNVALAVLMGSIVLGMAIIIAAVVHS